MIELTHVNGRLESVRVGGRHYVPLEDLFRAGEAAWRRRRELEEAFLDAVWLAEFDDTYECGHGATWNDDRCVESCDAHARMVRVRDALRKIRGS